MQVSRKWLKENKNKDQIIALQNERKTILEAVISGDITKDRGQVRLAEITREIKDLYEEGREFIFDSPIEEMLYQALLDYKPCFLKLVKEIKIVPQYRIGPYRLDFAVLANGGQIKIAVECDGFDFHDSTPEQATYDKQRDRCLTIAGFTVLRFSGHEINESVGACVGDIVKCIRTLIYGEAV